MDAMDAGKELIAKMSADIAAEEQKFFDLRERYETEAHQQPREHINAKIDEAYGRMMLVTAPMRRLRDKMIKRMAEIEGFDPPKPVIVDV